jgi:hypothetical protein
MLLSDAHYVLYIEDRKLLSEVYLGYDRDTGEWRKTDFDDAVHFATARDGYQFARLIGSELDSWRVGLRNGST